MKCIHCRRDIPEDALFCPYCGLVVEKESREPQGKTSERKREKHLDIIGETKVINSDELDEQLKELDKDWDERRRMPEGEIRPDDEEIDQKEWSKKIPDDVRESYEQKRRRQEEWLEEEDEDWEPDEEEDEEDDEEYEEWSRRQNVAERRENRARRPGKKSKRYLFPIFCVILTMLILVLGIWLVFSALDARQKASDNSKKAAVEERKQETGEDDIDDSTDTEKEPQEEIKMAITSTHDEQGEYYKLSTSGAIATTMLKQSRADNSPEKAIDGNERTSWQEGVDGPGTGESITVNLADTYKVKYLYLQLGNWNSEGYYVGNNRPKEVIIRVGDVTQTVTFPDGMREYWVELSEECLASDVQLTLQTVYPGDQWDDTCISEIGVYGRSNME